MFRALITAMIDLFGNRRYSGRTLSVTGYACGSASAIRRHGGGAGPYGGIRVIARHPSPQFIAENYRLQEDVFCARAERFKVKTGLRCLNRLFPAED